MASYRIYCLDGAGKIGFADWFEAAGDEAAIVEARRIRPDASGCEVWHRERMIARTNAEGRFERIAAALAADALPPHE